jgi:putative phosphoribosyl transferase
LSGPVEIAVVAGATHLFEEPGALDRVVELALDRLNRHLARAPSAQPGPTEGLRR